MLFAGGILSYFALPDEPGAASTAALVIAAIRLCLAVRGLGLGLIIGGSALALGFATAKLRTEIARAPVPARRCAAWR